MVAKNSAQGDKTSTEVEVKTDWSGVDSWDKAIAHFKGDLAESTIVFGDGVKLIEKAKLEGVEFILLECREVWNRKTGERDYINFLVMGRNGAKACFNDGSTGCMAQADGYKQTRGAFPAGIYCEKGLRSSTYEVEVDGKIQEATTFYFA